MAALDRALALEQVHDVAVRVGEDLHLDVPGAFDDAFDVERAVAECRRRLASCSRHELTGLGIRSNEPHAFSAAAGRGLDEHRIADRPRGRQHSIVSLIGRSAAWDHRHAGGLHQRARRDLRSHALDDSGRRTDEYESGLLARAGKRSPLREKPVSGMHRIGVP